MRVLLVTNGLGFGGAEGVVLAIARALVREGHAATVAATTRGGPIREMLSREDIAVRVLGLDHVFGPLLPLRIARLARQVRAEIVHAHLAIPDIAVALAHPLLFSARTMSTVHNSGVELGAVKAALWRRGLERMDRVLAVSDSARAALDPALSVEVLRPSLVSPEDPLPTREEARRRLGIAGELPLVMAVARLARVKGLDVLARASALLRSPGARVSVIGDGPEAASLRATGRLDLLPARADAAELLVAADVVVLPSRSEGFPQVALHAMAARRPVVATRVGGTPEIVRDGETGLLVPPEDPAALAAAIDALLADKALGDRYGRAGRERLVSAGFTREAMVRRQLEIYADVLR